jgi:hypothetical protein
MACTGTERLRSAQCTRVMNPGLDRPGGCANPLGYWVVPGKGLLVVYATAVALFLFVVVTEVTSEAFA